MSQKFKGSVSVFWAYSMEKKNMVLLKLLIVIRLDMQPSSLWTAGNKPAKQQHQLVLN